jgi:hypothetical protein
MPNLDRTGPKGDGPKTGRGLGVKRPARQAGAGAGRPGRGPGRGRGRV